MKKFFEVLTALLLIAVMAAWVAVGTVAAPALLKLCILYLMG